MGGRQRGDREMTGDNGSKVRQHADIAGDLRIDRWLWFARFFRTRALATAAVAGGHVRVNGERVSPGTRVRHGDRVQLLKDRLQYDLEILELPTRRGPASQARAAFSEDPESVRRRQEARDSLRSDRLQMPRTDGRPDKHTRRKLRERQRRPEDRE